MSRFPDHNSKPKHADSQDALEAMIRDLRITLDAHEPLGTVQRKDAIATVHTARRDVERCSTPFSEMIKYHEEGSRCIADFHWSDHMDLTMWLTQLSMDLIKQDYLNEVSSRPIDGARLDEGLKLVRQLDECRIQLLWER